MSIHTPSGREVSRSTALDGFFFVLGGLAAVWLALVLAFEGPGLGWAQLWFYLVVYLLVAYLVLPRIHRILTVLYVPDYFIGRARTSDGLLGDPVNLALLGREQQLHQALNRAGWVRADDVTPATSWRIVMSTLLRRTYREAPVSPLLLFGRMQDFAYQQEVEGNPAKRHHVRFWRCPEDWRLPGGRRADWVAAGTFDRAVGLSWFTLQVTHRIAEDTDLERDHIVRQLLAADEAVRVDVIEDFSTGFHSRNGGGDSIRTDGDLPIVDLRSLDAPPEPEVATDSRARRPAPTSVGTVLMLARATASVWIAIELWLAVQGLPPGEAASAASSVTAAAIVAAIGLAHFVLAWLVFSGVNWARVVAMIMATVSIATQIIDVVAAGAPLQLDSVVFGLALDVLVLLALSSDRARDWAKRDPQRKRATADPEPLARGGSRR